MIRFIKFGVKLYKLKLFTKLLTKMQATMSAYTVLDSVNKYRHGVLIGNFVQDQFGKDLNAKGPCPDVKKIPASKQHHDLNHSLYNRDPIISQVQPTQKSFYQTQKSNGQNYTRPQSQSTYSIFHQAQIPQTQSKFVANPKKQQRFNKQSKLYQQTRYELANKYGTKQQPKHLLSDQIPDILTGQIYKQRQEVTSDIKLPNQKTPIKIQAGSAKTKSINPYGTYSLIKPQIQKFQQVEYRKLVLPNEKGQKRDILFGHGLTLQNFQNNNIATTYDLSYNQKVKPQSQINSFYEPDLSQTAKQFHKDSLYQKKYQQQIPSYGNKQVLSSAKVSRPYEPYTKTFDKNHLKHEYLRK